MSRYPIASREHHIFKAGWYAGMRDHCMSTAKSADWAETRTRAVKAARRWNHRMITELRKVKV